MLSAYEVNYAFYCIFMLQSSNKKGELVKFFLLAYFFFAYFKESLIRNVFIGL